MIVVTVSFKQYKLGTKQLTTVSTMMSPFGEGEFDAA